MTSPDFSSRGIGKAMGEEALRQAGLLGYSAMQFNIVVKSNERAIRLWQKLGFGIIGEVPEAFDHKKKWIDKRIHYVQKTLKNPVI